VLITEYYRVESPNLNNIVVFEARDTRVASSTRYIRVVAFSAPELRAQCTVHIRARAPGPESTLAPEPISFPAPRSRG
jgi:hypothetical protein